MPETLRNDGLPANWPGRGPQRPQTPDQWIRGRLARTAGQPPQAPEPDREAPPAFRMPVESLRPGALPAGGTRARDRNEQFRDMLGR